MCIEIWRPIMGYESIYEISDHGRIKSLPRMVVSGKGSVRFQPVKILANVCDKKGYLIVRLCNNGKGMNYKVHQLVAKAFIPNPDSKPGVNHKDTIKDNNHVSNLEWSTTPENVKHAKENGLMANTANMKPVKVYKNNQQVDVVKSVAETCKKYKIGKTTLYEIINGKRESIKNYSFSF